MSQNCWKTLWNCYYRWLTSKSWNRPVCCFFGLLWMSLFNNMVQLPLAQICKSLSGLRRRFTEQVKVEIWQFNVVMSRRGARCFHDFSDRISFKIKTGDIEEKKKGFRKKSKQTDVSVQPTGKWIRRISQSERAISFSYVIIFYFNLIHLNDRWGDHMSDCMERKVRFPT